MQEIHALLRARFGASVEDWNTPLVGDPSILVKQESLHSVCAFLKEAPETQFDFLRIISAVDRGSVFSSVYHLYSYNLGHSAVLRVDLPKDSPMVASVSDIWPSANWHERESFDMMGIVYDSHPELRRILLPHDWQGYPLRKDYKPPESYHGIKHE